MSGETQSGINPPITCTKKSHPGMNQVALIIDYGLFCLILYNWSG